MKRDGMTIQQISQRTGLAPSAIRHYEAEGLVHPTRSAGGQRRFARADIRRLSFVLISQQLGFSLAEIHAQLAPLPSDRAPTKSDWTRISGRIARALDARIDRLQSLRDRLDSCIGCGCLSLASCHLYNAEDRAAAVGAGPRYLMGDMPVARPSPDEAS